VLPSGEIEVNLEVDFLEMDISCGLQVLESFGRMERPFVVLDISTRGKDLFSLGKNKWRGRKLKVSRPRVRDEEEEVPLPTYEYFKDDDPLKERVLTQILVGVKCQGGMRDHWRSVCMKRYRREKDKSSVSRRFVAMTMKKLVE
jgi:hypothetical protein